jgi:hypothetical protein
MTCIDSNDSHEQSDDYSDELYSSIEPKKDRVLNDLQSRPNLLSSEKPIEHILDTNLEQQELWTSIFCHCLHILTTRFLLPPVTHTSPAWRG